MKNEVLKNDSYSYYVVKNENAFVTSYQMSNENDVYSVGLCSRERQALHFDCSDLNNADKVSYFINGSIEKHTVNIIETKQKEVLKEKGGHI